ncbi:ABC transporter permease subunit [Nocardioides sp. InS609-2]|uniref:ABC transporter permease subunit n=1 Tax=Nocardioides sp. InS609-2 TaxID=2760705 RepID=UPI0020BEDC56|nr:ABC transporter permease subunit [Nocardioides sp. InS609-2]
MTTTTLTPTAARPAAREPRATTYARIPFSRIAGVELRKMFDTRSGFWLLMSIGILALLASGAVVLFAPDDEIAYGNFAGAIGIPMSILLPVIAILSVTGEWSQRSGLTTFTLVSSRGRVIAAKAVVAVAVGIVAIGVALTVGALGNVVGSQLAGVPTAWDVSVSSTAFIVLALVLGQLMGFMLGVLIRNSPGAIVGYFVYSFIVPTLSGLLAASQEWYRDIQHWVDFQYNQTGLYDATSLSGSGWTHLAATGAIWLVLPMVIGLWLVTRSEVK